MWGKGEKDREKEESEGVGLIECMICLWKRDYIIILTYTILECGMNIHFCIFTLAF